MMEESKSSGTIPTAHAPLCECSSYVSAVISVEGYHRVALRLQEAKRKAQRDHERWGKKHKSK